VELLTKVKEAIERENLIPEATRVVVGVSGGADSVALLHILHRLECDLAVAHLNHSIRGADAGADEAFVKELCAKSGIECVTSKADVPALAKEKGISLEMAAREARHDFFRTFTPSRIALAHHADDQVETFFLRAARGAGSAGLGGMRPVQTINQSQIVRPMLEIRRAEILEWLAGERLEWREDSSNADESIPRNFVRHQILPALGKINERVAENILRTMEILRDEENHPEKAARRREARDWLIGHGVTPTFAAIEKFIEFSRKTDGSRSLDLEGLQIVNEYGKVGRAVPDEPKTVTMKEGVGILRGPWEASISLQKIASREVIVRTPQPGDRMNPHGMEGSRKLQDIFTDLKIPRAQRADWPVVECGGEIIWLPKYRIARGWELADDFESALHLFARRSGGAVTNPSL